MAEDTPRNGTDWGQQAEAAEDVWERVPEGRGVCGKIVGVLGGGQLGRMLCQAASPLGISVAVLDPLEDAPARPMAYRHVVGSFQDMDTVRSFAKKCDVVTVEIEHVNVDALLRLEEEDSSIDIEPKPATIAVIQDKYLQKLHFRSKGVALPEFVAIPSLSSLRSAVVSLGLPLMLKSRMGAYDGRGNAVVRREEECEEAVEALGGFHRGLYAEQWAPFEKELAVMVARGRDGEIRSFPVVETTHRDNICHTVIAPAGISPLVEAHALQVAELAVGSLAGAGVFGVELFLLADGRVLLNEVAPRPHNSGHYSIEACHVSQYEQHLRAVTGMRMGDAGMKVKAAGMINILGEEDGDAGFAASQQLLQRALAVPGASIHWYGKKEMRSQRKMGHVTVVGSSRAQVQQRMQAIAAAQAGEGEQASAAPPVVSIIMGSDSDLPVMKGAAQILDFFQVPYELTIVSAHRTPSRLVSFAQSAHSRGLRCIIAGAGGAAHLPGMVAALTPLPVVGVPVRGGVMDGMDALMSIVQMPRGIPVATVAINNSSNAALLAVRMLGATDQGIRDKMLSYQRDLEEMVEGKARQLEEAGWEQYLKSMNAE